MSDHTESRRTTTGLPDWFFPGPPGGWTAEMLDHLELIDGALVMRPPQTWFHMLVLRLLERGIRPPADLMVVREMTVTLGMRQRPEPDIMLVRCSAVTTSVTSFEPQHVHLVVEVASPESLDRDRTTKPIKYSTAGIKYLWRLEEDQGLVAYTYELDRAVKAYVPTGVHRGRLKTDIGFPVDIDLDLDAVR
ncbi:Uma2 family endonuclease [Thermocatellispora tengchongensis]|uniref:Uma2 family endonuclease n=1 Tax=Thermocatellispora tengchongensis TaxID=1073253 RepID=A0A840P1P4_9ACTN|nr:Uma2 family endonuclease [Thermocatellispora tengchongensis]MBB5131811.1 Uma2 family endonuclease [Thermocatellispora tengchongensis]